MHTYRNGHYVTWPRYVAAGYRVIVGSNPIEVFLYGSEYGDLAYIVAEDLCEAWQEMLAREADVGNICDHGGDITDEQRYVQLDAGGVETCDCSETDDGRWVWAVNLWLRPLRLPADLLLANTIDRDGITVLA